MSLEFSQCEKQDTCPSGASDCGQVSLALPLWQNLKDQVGLGSLLQRGTQNLNPKQTTAGYKLAENTIATLPRELR